MNVIEEVKRRLPYATSPLEVLERMRKIVEVDAIVHSAYNVDTGEELPAICGGNKFCAVGSMFWAAGVPIYHNEGTAYMWGAANDQRQRTFEGTPHLEEAWDAVEAAATVWMADHAHRLTRSSDGSSYSFTFEANGRLETLFEAYDLDGEDIGYQQLLEIVDLAIAELRQR